MKTILTFAAVFFLVANVASAATKPLKICLDSKGQIIAKGKCAKGQTAVSLASLTALVASSQGPTGPQGPAGAQGPKGDKGDDGVPGTSDLIVSDGSPTTSIPPCIIAPPFITCSITGVATTTSLCPTNTKAILNFCISKTAGFPVSISAGTVSASGPSSCSFSNFTTTAIAGTFYSRSICMQTPEY